MSNELKPCPFCGGKAELKNELQDRVVCTDCRANGPYFLTSNDAIEAWNTRAENEIGISKFQKITGTSYIESKNILTSLEQAGAKVVE